MGLWQRLKDGANKLTPLQNLRGQRVGIIGQVIGMVFAMVAMVFAGLWYWTPFLLFSVGILVLQYISVMQQIRKLEEFT